MFSMEKEPYIRLGFFIGIFALMDIWELLAPKRYLTVPKGVRWFNNLSIVVLNSLLLRLLLPVLAIEVARIGEEQGLGILNKIDMPGLWAGLTAVLFLDFIVYLQHAAFHILPHPWKLHMMHHTDLDLDVTTGARFHPIEMILSMFIKTAAVLIIGAPAWSVLVFEVLLNATAMFNHSNINIPAEADRILRLFVVTPDMHRIHHSVIIRETNSNYSFNFPWWDRIFKTYIEQPKMGHLEMKIGLANFRNPSKLTLLHMIAIPFQKRTR